MLWVFGVVIKLVVWLECILNLLKLWNILVLLWVLFLIWNCWFCGVIVVLVLFLVGVMGWELVGVVVNVFNIKFRVVILWSFSV